MNKSTLMDKIASEASCTKRQAEEIFEAAIYVIMKELSKGNKVSISGFGSFLVKKRHSRFCVDPRDTSKKIKIPEMKIAKFKTGKTLKDILKGKQKI